MTATKTSQTYPLRIDALAVPGVSGSIGLTFCPGKKQCGALSGTWDRDLATDLRAIKAFGATALLTLMEPKELARVKVPVSLIAAETDALGLEWHLLPIQDVSIPGEVFEDQWTYSGTRLRNLLKCGNNVVIHCLGGLGRTGTAAARLLVEFGETAESAIQKVRQARPGSIETRAQEDYVRTCQRGISHSGNPILAERTLACLLGGALGDAFGYAVEFDSIAEIRSRFGPAGIADAVFHDGKLIVSDDTQMTLFTLEGMLTAVAGGDSTPASCLTAIQTAYIQWLETQNHRQPRKGVGGSLARQPEMYVRRAPGNTCLSALSAGGHGTIASPINGSKGCGGVMRVAPIGLFANHLNSELTFRLGAEAAALTHGHSSGYLSAGVMASMVRSLALGADIKTAIEESCALLKQYTGHEETIRAVHQAVQLAGEQLDHAVAVGRIGAGWVGEEALAIGLYAVMSSETFVEAVRIAANHSGDSDSTASITGQLWGAKAGIDGMPHRWVTRIDVMRPLLNLARRAISQV
jgi:ADP-ribosyl-[dinitrogen reductase] hydrolase